MDLLFDLPDDIYADDIAEAHSLGDTFRTVFFTWIKLPGENVLRRKPVASIVRPSRTLEAGKVSRLLALHPIVRKDMVLHS